ncbi:MAG: PTPDL family protein [Verrucomicrobiota bacterium]
MKYKTMVLLIPLLACAAARADQFTMKDGRVFEATILREDKENFVLEVQVSKSIRDERTIAKKDITRVSKSDPSVPVFNEKVAGLLPVPDLSSEDEYARRIAVVEDFRKQFPYGEKNTEAKGILAKLKSEANEISKGGRKIKGVIIGEEEYKANRYEVDAQIEESRIMALLSRGQTVAALRDFERMGKEFANTAAYCNLAPVVVRAARTYVNQVSALLNSLEQRMKDRDTGLAQMTGDDKRTAETALAEQKRAAENRFEAEKQSDVGWVTADAYHQDSLEETVDYGNSAIAEMDAIPATPLPDGGEIYRKCYATVHDPEATSAAIKAALNPLRSAKLPAKYVVPLQAEAKQAEERIKADKLKKKKEESEGGSRKIPPSPPKEKEAPTPSASDPNMVR